VIDSRLHVIVDAFVRLVVGVFAASSFSRADEGEAVCAAAARSRNGSGSSVR